ncbi:MAG: GGDEF domain-containing protein [Lachnospiraceae bacterium]|nr:GGDEF domain-containing protein [Lachnospiraceae bacterium]
MSALEERIRDRIVRVIRSFVFICIGLDTLFFLYYFATDGLTISPGKYILVRLVLPFTINLIVWRVAAYVNNNAKCSTEVKKYVVSFMLCSIGGVMGICHSYFTPLWCTPILAAMFSVVFYDRRLLRWLVTYSCILSFLAMCEIIWEHPDEAGYYVQHEAVVIGINVLIAVIAFTMLRYTNEMVDMIKESSKQLETDALTGLHSRPYIYRRANELLQGASDDRPVSVAIVDLDHFKRVNDTYGHENGDVVLRAFGKLVGDMESDNLTAGRYGGEEFVLLFRYGSAEDDIEILEQLRRRFSEIHYDFSEDSVTFSAGIRTVNEAADFEDIFTLIDQALYRAKSQGRNRITVDR